MATSNHFSMAQPKIIFHNYRFGKDTLKNYYIVNGRNNIKKFIFQTLISKTNTDTIDIHLIVYGIKTDGGIIQPISMSEEDKIEKTEVINMIVANQEFSAIKIKNMLTETLETVPVYRNLSYVSLTPQYNSANQTIFFSVQAHTEETKEGNKTSRVGTAQSTDPSPPAPPGFQFTKY